MTKLRIGTCSWKYPSWKGLVYSEGVDNYLEEYARKYSTVEIDQWFWSLFPNAKPRLPDPNVVREYRDSVPKDFRFTVKAPNSITLTHPYARGKEGPAEPNPDFLSARLATEFLDNLKPIQQQLGAVIFQFEYLNRQKMESREAFEKKMAAFRKKLPDSYPYAVEVRNGNYLTPQFLDFLLDQEWIPVFLQGYWMPPVAELWAKMEKSIRRFRTFVFRLHGTDRERMEKETGETWNRIVNPRERELADIAGIVSELSGSRKEIYVNVNNHFEGSAPLTIERFLKFYKP
jgi:uncharacterized protein YecE (DUF72 family)